MKLTGQDSSETKHRIFENINETLGEANVFIYSPVVEPGVDITVPVRKIYGALRQEQQAAGVPADAREVPERGRRGGGAPQRS